jgi:hypothetical protein
MTITSRFVLIPALAFLATGATALPALSAAHSDLDKMRGAMAAYMEDAARAEADGYVKGRDCVQADGGMAAMGVHYSHPGLEEDPSIDPTKPEILLYEPTENGPMLRGVEYVATIGAPGAEVPASPPPKPTLFGQAFEGPMAGHGPNGPPHYDLHVWFDNPAGMFAGMNPKVTCPAE